MPTLPPRPIGPDDVVESSNPNGSVGRPPFRVNGRQYLSGIGLSLVDGTDYPGDSQDIIVPAGYTQLVATIGLDDESSAQSSFHVSVLRAATKEVLWEGDMGLEQPRDLTLNVAGIARIRLFGTGLNRTYANKDGEVVLTGEFLP